IPSPIALTTLGDKSAASKVTASGIASGEPSTLASVPVAGGCVDGCARVPAAGPGKSDDRTTFKVIGGKTGRLKEPGSGCGFAIRFCGVFQVFPVKLSLSWCTCGVAANMALPACICSWWDSKLVFPTALLSIALSSIALFPVAAAASEMKLDD